MKALVNIARILVGLLFIFSGLVKAIDPLGLSYKMQEFFEAWSNDGFMKGLMNSLTNYSLSFAVFMITLEVVLGVSLLFGWQKRLTSWLLLLLTLFFAFLTSYVLFTGKIRACGCFGDCIPLTPFQTFTKDIFLLVLIIFILYSGRSIQPFFGRTFGSIVIILSIILVSLLQWYVLKHLPLVDCLPYKKGNNILLLRNMPANATPDKYDYVFIYEKGGETKEFKVATLPDSTWKFIERKQTLLQKGKNNTPQVTDFSLTTASGNDTTEAILNQGEKYYLLFLKEKKNEMNWLKSFYSFYAKVKGNYKVYIVTSQFKEVNQLFNNEREPLHLPIFICDATAIKTAARCLPTLYLMNGPVVVDKWSWADFDKALGN